MRDKLEIVKIEHRYWGRLTVYVLPDKRVYFKAYQVARAVGYLKPKEAVKKYCENAVEMIDIIFGEEDLTGWLPDGNKLQNKIMRQKVIQVQDIDNLIYGKVSKHFEWFGENVFKPIEDKYGLEL